MTKSKYNIVKAALLFFTLFFTLHAFAFSFGSIFNAFHKQKPKHHSVKHVAVDNRKHIKVGVYVLHVGKYDFQSASTQMDFYLIFNCDTVCKGMSFEIMNATDANVHLVAKQGNTLIYRVQGNLTKSDNLRNYPFDSHAIEILIEDRQQTSDKMIFVTDPKMTALDTNLTVVGFQLLPKWTAVVSDHYYQVFQQSFSSYKFSMYIKRPFLAGVLKGVLPALIIVCCCFLALLMRIDHISQRIGIATSTLIAAVVFHLNLTASLPPLGYITFADMFMLINYVALLVILFEIVLTAYIIDTKHRPLAERCNEICAWAVPLGWLILQIINWIAFNPTSLNY